MNELVQKTILVGLAKRLADKGSWAGETHLQKAAYLLSELRRVEFNFDFILYKHGPFSFGLHDELSALREEGLIEGFAPDPRYGPRLLVTSRGGELERRFGKTVRRYGESLDWITDILGKRGVTDLERLATAMWVTRQDPNATASLRAKALCDVKPHISLDAATEAVEEIDHLLAEQEAPPVG